MIMLAELNAATTRRVGDVGLAFADPVLTLAGVTRLQGRDAASSLVLLTQPADYC